MLVRMCNYWNFQTLLVGMQNGTAALENSWQFYTKLNIYLLYDSASPLLGILRKRNRNVKSIGKYVFKCL